MTSPAERADKVRAILDGKDAPWATSSRPPEPLLPAGSVILTPDEQETIRQAGDDLCDVIKDFVRGVEIAEALYVGELDNWWVALALLGGDK